MDLIGAATGYVERRTGWHLGEPQEFTAHLCGQGTGTLWLPQPPVAGTVEIEDVEEESYEVRGARIVRLDDVWEFGRTYEVTYEAGYVTGTGPADLRQAVRLLVAGWYRNREAWATGTIVMDHKHTVDELVGTYERVRT